jgi:hypothetical protein
MNDENKIIEDLKFIRTEIHEAYEMNDKILLGYALNRLDTLLFELTKDKTIEKCHCKHSGTCRYEKVILENDEICRFRET